MKNLSPILVCLLLVISATSHAGTTTEATFNSGAITDAFGVNIHSGVNPYSLATNGLGGTQGLDLNISGTDDATLVFKTAAFNPATLASVEMSCFIKKQATTAGTEAISLGLVGALTTKLTGYNDTATLEDCWARLRLVRNVNALRFEVQSKAGGTGSGTTHVLGSNLSMTDGSWYQLSATFTRLSATQIRISGVLREADASGAPGVVVATQGNTDITLPDLATDTQVYAALRGYGPAGADAWDNFSVTASAAGEAAPSAPSSLAVASGPTGRVLLTWADNGANEDGFIVSRSSTAGGAYTDIATLRANVTCYVDPVTGVTPWFYKVRTFNSGGSASSAPAALQPLYRWKNVAVGGGGYITGIYLHALEAGLIYLRTDVGGLYRWDAVNARWLALTDHFGVDDFNLYGCSGFALDPQNTNVLYMAAGKSLATAGVMFKSTDRGASWNRLALANVEMHGNSATRNGGERLVVNPFDPNIVLYGSHSDGLQRSADGGVTWAQVAGFPGTLTAGTGITAIAFDPTNAGFVYAAAYGDAVCRSTDHGVTWTKLTGGPAQVNRLVVATGGTLIATHQSGVAKYALGSWTLTTPAGAIPMCGLAVNPGNANDVIVAEAETNTSATYRSSDGGSTWSPLSRSSTNNVPWQDGFRSGNPHVAALAFDPGSSGRLWLTDWYGVWRTNNINASTPNFTNEATGLEEVVTFALHAPSSGPQLLSGVADNNGFRYGTQTSLDVFPSARYDGFVAETYSIASCASDALKIVRGCGGRNGLWRVFNSTDGGVNWTETSWNSALGSTARPLRVAMSATSAQNVVVVVDGGTARSTTDGGTTWQTVSGLPSGPAGPFYFGQPLASDSVTGARFYYHDASTGAIYRSADAGATFVQVNAGALLPVSTFATKLKAMPGVADDLWVCLDSGGLYRSTNGGTSFSKINSVGRAYTFAFGKAPAGNPNPALYVYGSISGQNGFLFRSLDLGSTWTDISDPNAAIGNAPHIMEASMQREGQLFLGTNGRGIYSGEPLGPEIRVFAGPDESSSELSDGLTFVNYGTTGVGIPATRSFTVKNDGNADLHLTSLALPAGFAKEGAAFAPVTLVPTATYTFYVRLLANAGQGEFGGWLSLGSDDADEAIFDVSIFGTVLNPAQVAQEAYLKASNGQANDRLGASVAVSGDTVVVGAVFEDSGVPGNPADNSATDAGAAYVFVRNPLTGAWSQQAYLKASNPGAGDNFGLSVAIDGDTVAVSARLEDSAATGINGNQNDNSATDSGAVYVFTRSGTTWTQQAYIKASNTNAEDVFGHRLALSGETLVVCAPFEDSAATGLNGNQNDNSAAFAGAAYVFTRTGTVWSQQAYLKASNTGAGDRFGTAADISGDTIVVASGNEDSGDYGVDGNQADNSVSNAGAAYVFERTGSTWSQQAYLKASNPDVGDEFGLPLVISPDGNTLVIGAVFEDSNGTGINLDQNDNSATDSGALYVFRRFGPTWYQEAYLKAPNAEANDWLGNGKGLSIYGDRLVVGAANEDSNATGIDGNQANNSAADSGAAYLYDRVGGQWFYRSYIKAPNTNAGDQFGYNTVIAGSPTGVRMFVTSFAEDSAATTINGNQADNSAADAGAVYVYDLSPQPEIVVEHPEGSGLNSGMSVGFVPLALGTSVNETFIIKNIGGGALTGLSAVASPMTEFNVLTPAPLPALLPGNSVSVVVRFSPVATGPRTGMLIISSNDADEYNFILNLTGTGLDMTGPAGGTMTLSPASPLAFGAEFTINFSGWSDNSLPLTYDVLIDNGLIASHGTNPIIQAMDPGVLGTHELKGRIYDALGNMTEVIQTFMVGTSQQNWRNQYFGTTSNSGNAADAYDYDKDGLPNLLEWACGLNPTVTSPLPTPTTVNGGNIEFTYPRSVSARNSGGTFTVEWSDTLPGTNWSSTGVTEQILSDNGTVQQVRALVPAGTGGKRFVRLRVTGPP